MGFACVTTEPRTRRSWRNFKSVKLNYIQRTSVAALRKRKRELITTGKIDVGIPIVPIDYTAVRIKKDGKLVSSEKNKKIMINDNF